ncbi:hypothetical protein TVAG_386170 [Trichomonas vaginalis G3]|uniref:Uncharacterized protein n=1 Tax=Trichomonas vaginalis (strain ATCC PRA-98 / G3) TaxID=412133 RepID=A2FSD4_TRIV3|nr:hypothetical protein TVAGG3_0969200 [Trichomonas vaginalis G3]EAX92193.1 hypothetical protein TVAG_386170 [Trichomonas vaginalis G3]KAI5488466.1 hypothetical protein TVAGG3_0969200 [Trichomonas vaginalis G3]|eukprot:XP_001305123.1 hypothetical protein [Trichomonas vaginalis G3]
MCKEKDQVKGSKKGAKDQSKEEALPDTFYLSELIPPVHCESDSEQNAKVDMDMSNSETN